MNTTTKTRKAGSPSKAAASKPLARKLTEAEHAEAEAAAKVQPLAARQADQASRRSEAVESARVAVDTYLKAESGYNATKQALAGNGTNALGLGHLAVSRAAIALREAGVPASKGSEGEATVADILTQASAAELAGKPRKTFSPAYVTAALSLAPRASLVALAVGTVDALIAGKDEPSAIDVDGHLVMTIRSASGRRGEDAFPAFLETFAQAYREARESDGDEPTPWQKVWKSLESQSRSKTFAEKIAATMDLVNDTAKNSPAEVRAAKGALEGLQRAIALALK